LPIANQKSILIFVIAFIYFCFQSPADVKFFGNLIFTADNERASRLVSIAGVIGTLLPRLAINATSKNPIF